MRDANVTFINTTIPLTASSNPFELKDSFAFVTNDVEFTRARQGVEQPATSEIHFVLKTSTSPEHVKGWSSPRSPRFTSCSRHRLHTSTSRGGAARDLQDSLRALDVDFTRARQEEEQPAISKMLVMLNSIDASHLFDASHHHPSASTTVFC
jgi:hypothetical protein